MSKNISTLIAAISAIGSKIFGQKDDGTPGWIDGDTLVVGSGKVGGQSVIGGTGTTDSLTLQSTSGVGAIGANVKIKVGNNGGTQALTVRNDGNVGILSTYPIYTLHLEKAGPSFGMWSKDSGYNPNNMYFWKTDPSGNHLDGSQTIAQFLATAKNTGEAQSTAAAITMAQDSSSATGVAGSLGFRTSNGATTGTTQRMSIASNGDIATGPGKFTISLPNDVLFPYSATQNITDPSKGGEYTFWTANFNQFVNLTGNEVGTQFYQGLQGNVDISETTDYTFAPGSEATAVNGFTNYRGSHVFPWAVGFWADTFNYGTGSITIANGYNSVVGADGPGSVTNAIGFSSSFAVRNGGSIENITGYRIVDPPTVNGTVYGFDSNISSGTNRYNIYSRGTAPNYFAGPIINAQKTPSSASDTGVAGTIAADANYIYICCATNTWKRVAVATWDD